MADIKSRTIDNIGIDTSSRYARDQATLSQKVISDSRLVPLGTDTSVITPYRPSEFQEYLAPELTNWASFPSPPQAHPLFIYQVVPSLGNPEEKRDRLEATETSTLEEDKQKKTLVRFLKTVDDLDRILSKIDACRNQYHRG